jgi:hypothetical protein
MDTRQKNQHQSMKNYIYIALLLLVIGCTPHGGTNPNKPLPILPVDSVYITADFRKYGDYYHTGHQVYAIDLLSQGLEYDSAYHIYGSGCNLYLSDVFTTCDSLPAGHYQMDSVAKEGTFLRGMDFEGNITGTYLLQIYEDKIERITSFTSGSMDVDYLDGNILLEYSLYTADSTLYRATYRGPAMYR